MILLDNCINYSCWIRSQDGKRLISEIDRVIYYFDSLIIINICTYMTRYVVFFFFFYYYFDNPSVAFCDKFSLFVRSRLISLPLAHSLARSCALSLSLSLSLIFFFFRMKSAHVKFRSIVQQTSFASNGRVTHDRDTNK